MRDKIVTILIWVMIGITLPFLAAAAVMGFLLLIPWMVIGIFVAGLSEQGDYL